MAMRKLHIGCGRDIKEGFINIDRIPLEGIGLVLNVGKERFPYEDNSVDYVLATHFIEHLDTEETDLFLTELHRICKPHSIIEFTAPHYLSPTSCRPFHKQRISETYFVDYEVMDESKVHSLDHKFFFKVESRTEYKCNLPETIYFKLEVIK